MKGTRFSQEKIIGILKEGGVQDRYRWRRKYGGLPQAHLRLDSRRVFVL